MATMSAWGAGSRNESPDFAFPKKVEQQAERDLLASLRSGNGDGVVNALVRKGLAQVAVSLDSLPAVLSEIDRVRSEEKNPVTRGVLAVLEAKIYGDLYTKDRWTIDQRPEIAARAVTDDYNLWNGTMFVRKVRSLVGDALSDIDTLKATPIDAYGESVEIEGAARTFYPTMFDFVAWRCIACLNVFTSYSASFSYALLENPFDTTLYRPGTTDSLILEIYRSIADGRQDSAPGMLALSGAMRFVAPRVFTVERPAFDFAYSRENNAEETEATRYLDAYRKYIGETQYAVELLLAARRVDPGWTIARDYYNALDNFVSDYPGYFNIGGVKDKLADISIRTVTLQLPRQIERGKPFRIDVSTQNVGELTLKLYKLNSSAVKRDASRYNGSLGSPVETVTVKLDGEVPFAGVSEASLTASEYGRYVVTADFEGKEKEENGHQIIDCSDIATGVVQEPGGRQCGVVMNVGDGAPVSDASLIFSPWDRRSVPSSLPGVTGADGFMEFKTDKAGTVYATLGDDIFSRSVSAYVRNYDSADGGVYASVVTSLGVYKPGDKMEYAVVLYNLDRSGRSPVVSRQFTVRMRDANYQEVSSTRLTTDGWGRAQGEFNLPEDGLTGMFALEIADEDIRNRNRFFMVSDYKLPTFEAKITSTRRPSRIGDAAVIEGYARTYAGFPVENAAVKLQLKVRVGGWWAARVTPVFFETETMTGEGGVFTVTVPADVIASAPITDGYFVADLAVTSQDGETHSVTGGFNMGRPDYIRASIPGEYNASTGDEVRVELLDYDDKPQTAELKYKINKAVTERGVTTYPDLVKDGTFRPGDFGKILAGLPSGRYGVILSTSDPSLAEPTGVAEVTVWRPTDTVCYADRLLWIPEESLTADAGGKATVTLGSNAPGNNILLILSDEKGDIVSSEWIEATGMQHVDVRLPAGVTALTGYLSTIHDCDMATAVFTVRQASCGKKITVHTTTFRDKVVPGDREHITLKVSGMDGALTESALMIDMSSKAVDAIRENRFSINPAELGSQSPYMSYPSFPTAWIHGASKSGRFKSVNVVEPVFRMYGRSFTRDGVYNMSSIRIRGSRKMSTTEVADDEIAVEEVAEQVLNGAADQKMAYAAGSVTTMTADGGGTLEEDAVAVGNEPGPEADAEISYRPSELPLAFFRPMLTTDMDGNIEIAYTVPDANTTWVLRSLAYNRELQTAVDKVEIVASKPIMVSSNPTRFLRCGDRVNLPAMVMNATDSTVVAHSVVELLTVGDRRRIAMSESTDTLAPGKSCVTGIGFDVPEDLGGVIFRVGSTAGNFTDGEQVFIQILPSEQNVVETANFYIAPGNNHFTRELPAVDEGRAYLRYTGNPAWEVVSAFPGLRNSDFNSSLSAAGELFSAAVADGLMNRYPEIARTIRRWADNPADSALVSLLEKNSELKDMLLDSTPWVGDALDTAERMQRLVLLLDRRNTAKTISRAVGALRKMFVSGQGWCWTSSYPEYSEWCTMQILDILGGLNRMGWLPDNNQLNSMIEEAVKFCDKRAAAEYAKYPKGDFTRYCYMRMKYNNIKLSTAASGTVSAQVARIVSSWKEHDVMMKAMDALILNANGYAATARQILASLNEYATYTPDRGMWWSQLDNRYSLWSMNRVGATGIVLDAYASVDPSAPEVDRIRQWLVLNKADNSWGNAIITTQVITSLLTSGGNWTVNSAAIAVRVNNTLLTPSEEYATGAFTEQITSMVKNGGELVIDRQGDYPSFGGVVTMRVLPMSEVKSSGSDELSVEKYMTVFNGSEWVPSETFTVGDRVKVTLALRADKDMSYMVVTDKRAAGLEPVDQLPVPMYADGLCFYRENRDSQTNIFIDFLPKGTYMLEYELFALQEGRYSSGVAQVQSQYNPLNAAHSGGSFVTIKKK